MAMQKQSDDSNFVTIGKGLYLSKPQAGIARVNSDTVVQPTVILLFGWMGAKLPHLYKYTKVYDELYPDATKILVRTEPSFFWSSERAKRAALAPVVEALEALGCIPQSQKGATTSGGPIEPIVPFPAPRVLVHAFSNGGCLQLTTLSSVLSSRLSASQASTLPEVPSVLILDSAPGSGGVRVTQKAFAGTVRNPILRRIMNALIALLYAYSHIVRWLFRQRTVFDVLRAKLISAKLLPWYGTATRRLYLYSTADDLVLWQDVEKHANEAEAAGLIVRKEKFGPSMHVAHARAEPERYWTAVKEVWEAAAAST